MGFRSRWCLIVVSSVVLCGCAATESDTRQSRSAETFRPPSWADHSQGQSGGEIWFVGNGEAGIEAEARRKAEATAESLYVRYLGADVLVGERLIATSSTAVSGINVDKLDLRQYASLSSTAFISEPRFEYVTNEHPQGYSVWTRMFIPESVHRNVKDDVDAAYRERNEKMAKARLKVEQNRYNAGEGQVFAMTTGMAIRRFDSRHPLRSESVAIDAARMDALIKLSENLTGTKIDNVRLQSGGLSRAYSGGHVFHDELSTRVWIIGDEVKATVTMLGWVAK